MIVLPIAGGHGNVVISQKAADMYIASATTRTGYVARGIAGKEAYSVVEPYQTAARDILCGGYFYDHVACGIASGQGGTKNRLTCHAADIERSLHCGRGTASGDGTEPLITHLQVRLVRQIIELVDVHLYSKAFHSLLLHHFFATFELPSN